MNVGLRTIREAWQGRCKSNSGNVLRARKLRCRQSHCIIKNSIKARENAGYMKRNYK